MSIAIGMGVGVSWLPGEGQATGPSPTGVWEQLNAEIWSNVAQGFVWGTD